nr:MAG TPA: hypothetical protein [Caudoviricetes sp.]
MSNTVRILNRKRTIKNDIRCRLSIIIFFHYIEETRLTSKIHPVILLNNLFFFASDHLRNPSLDTPMLFIVAHCYSRFTIYSRLYFYSRSPY